MLSTQFCKHQLSAFCGRRKWMRPSPRSTWAMEQCFFLWQLGSWNAPRCFETDGNTFAVYPLKRFEIPRVTGMKWLGAWWIWKCFGCSSWHQKGVQWWCCPTKSSSRAATQTWRAKGSSSTKPDWIRIRKKRHEKSDGEDCFVFQHFLPSFSAGNPIGWHISAEASLWRGWRLRHVDRFLEAAEDVEVPNIWLGSTWEIQRVGTWRCWRCWRCFTTSKVHVEQSSFQLKIDMVANRFNRHANPCETFLEMYNALPSPFPQVGRQQPWWHRLQRGFSSLELWISMHCCSVQGNGQILQ